MHDEETGVDNALTRHRHVVEHVLGGFYTGGSVDIAAELGANVLQVLEHLLAGEILEAVETHMLKEVGQTVLVRSLLDCSDMCREVELGTLCRLVVMPDVVSHAIVQLADFHGRIVGKRALSASDDCGAKDRCKEN